MARKMKKIGPTTKSASNVVERNNNDILIESASLTAKENFGLPTQDDFASLQLEMHSNIDCLTMVVTQITQRVHKDPSPGGERGY